MEPMKACEESQIDHEVNAVEVNEPSTYRITMRRTRSRARSCDEFKRPAEDRKAQSGCQEIQAGTKR